VEIYGRVRRAVRVEGKSQRAVAREFGLSRETVRKHPAAPFNGSLQSAFGRAAFLAHRYESEAEPSIPPVFFLHWTWNPSRYEAGEVERINQVLASNHRDDPRTR
jgi:hypothetical protein